MKLAVWAYTAAVSLVSLAVAAFGGTFGSYYYRVGLFNGKPLPVLTKFLNEYHGCAAVFPLLWLCAAIWPSRRGAATPDRVFAFAGVSTLVITFLSTFVAVALTLPFIVIIVSMG